MKIFFTKRAEKNYRSLKKFITAKWGARIFNLFEAKTIDFLDLLQELPEIGTVEHVEKQIRGFQLSKQIRVFYRIKGEKIIILAFFDVRQNPTKKPG